MNKICSTVFQHTLLESAGDLFKFCAAGEVEKVKQLITENVNIYEHLEKGFTFTSLLVALTVKNEIIANLLLDIYERDLEALCGSSYKRALVATPVDQTEEFMETVETVISNEHDFVPVLLKNNNSETPKCVYLRKKQKNKNDQSMVLAMKLETKNGACDLNWHRVFERLTDSFLHLAIYHEMKTSLNDCLRIRRLIRKLSMNTAIHRCITQFSKEILTLSLLYYLTIMKVCCTTQLTCIKLQLQEN